MERTKSNVYPISGEKKNAFNQMIELWKADVNWNNHTKKERKVCIWFGISAATVLCLLHTWLVVPAFISTAVAATKLGGINVEE